MGHGHRLQRLVRPREGRRTVLLRPIHLSYYSSFHALDEDLDYHTLILRLIRSLHFDVPSSKIEVRKPIEVSTFAIGPGESEGFM